MASFTPASTLSSLANAGSVTFKAAGTVGNLTGTGTTTFDSSANLAGGVSNGVVDITGSSTIGAVTGGVLTLRSSLNTVGSIAGTADVRILNQATATAGLLSGGTVANAGSFTAQTLSGGSITNSGTLFINTLNAGSISGVGAIRAEQGTFAGSILDAATLYTSGALTIGSAAVVPSVIYDVAQTGSLTFTGSRNIGILANSGTVTFNGGSWNTQTGSGTVKVASGTLSVSKGSGSLVVQPGAKAAYSSAVSLDRVTVDLTGTLNLFDGSAVKDIESVGTLIHAGSLTISNGGSISALAGGSLTSLTKSGAGTLTLGGTYAGSTFVSGGELNLLGDAVLSGAVTVNGGTLTLSTAEKFGGNVSLLSGVINLGQSAKVTVGSFSASGGVLNGNQLTADVLNITGGSINAKTVRAGGGPLSYSGTSSQPEIGVSGLTESFSYSGLGGGTLRTGIVYAQNLSVSGSSNTLLLTGGSSSAAADTTALTISGTNNTVNFTEGFTTAGSLVLTVGDASSTGGTLIVGPGGLSLSAGSTLKGKGLIKGNVLSRRGSVVAPGNSPGILTIDGALTIEAGAPAEFEYTAEKQIAVGAGEADRLVLDTLTSLGDQVSSVAVGGSLVGGTFQASGVSRVNELGTKSVPVVTYGSGSAPALPAVRSYVTVNGGTYESAVVTAKLTAVNALAGGTLYLNVTRNAFASFATGNVSATGELLDRALKADNVAVSNLIDQLDTRPTRAGVVSILSALDPGVYAELGNIGIDRLRDLQAGLSNHIDMLALDTVGESSLSLAIKPGQSAAEAAIEQSRAWTTGYGGWGKRDSDSTVGSAGYSSNNFGNISGVETRLGALTLGITGAFGTSTANFESGKGKVTTDSWHTGLYGNFAAGAVVFDAAFAYGQSESLLQRNVNVLGGGATSGRSQGSEWSGQFGLAVPVRVDAGSLVFTPSVHVLHSNVKQDALTESSLNGLEAVVRGNTTKSTALRTGLQAAKITKLGGVGTRLTASLDWVHSFDSDRNDVEIALSGAGSATSRFRGSRSGQDAVRLGLGAEFALSERTRFRLNVDEQMRSGVRSTYGSASLGFQF